MGDPISREATAKDQSPEGLYSPFDRAMEALFERCFERHRLLSVAAALALYLSASLALGPRLAVSTNYLVILPVIATAAAYGLRGGVAAGIVALPANLAIFWLLGHPEYSPASKPIAELSGMLVGATMGYLADYHRRLNAERRQRKRTELDLRAALDDKEALFREVHHRVKNNLNLIKSIVGLQSRRSQDPSFKEAAAVLTGRIMSISFVHERLCKTAQLSSVALDEHLADMVAAILMSVGNSRHNVATRLELAPMSVSMDVAVPMGLIVNELVTNALRHARPDGTALELCLSLSATADGLTLSASDDGVGFPDLPEGGRLSIERAAVMATDRLGLTLLDLMCSQLGGEGRYERIGGRTVFTLAIGRAETASHDGIARASAP